MLFTGYALKFAYMVFEQSKEKDELLSNDSKDDNNDNMILAELSPMLANEDSEKDD